MKTHGTPTPYTPVHVYLSFWVRKAEGTQMYYILLIATMHEFPMLNN